MEIPIETNKQNELSAKEYFDDLIERLGIEISEENNWDTKKGKSYLFFSNLNFSDSLFQLRRKFKVTILYREIKSKGFIAACQFLKPIDSWEIENHFAPKLLKKRVLKAPRSLQNLTAVTLEERFFQKDLSRLLAGEELPDQLAEFVRKETEILTGPGYVINVVNEEDIQIQEILKKEEKEYAEKSKKKDSGIQFKETRSQQKILEIKPIDLVPKQTEQNKKSKSIRNQGKSVYQVAENKKDSQKRHNSSLDEPESPERGESLNTPGPRSQSKNSMLLSTPVSSKKSTYNRNKAYTSSKKKGSSGDSKKQSKKEH